MNFNNTDEALRARDLAKREMEKSNFPKALNLAVKARDLDSKLDNIEQMIMVCEVNCLATQDCFGGKKKKDEDMDWYGILQVEPEADVNIVRKQYRKLVLCLHPDKNKFPGAEEAFKLVQEAQSVLMDTYKRRLYDSKRKLQRPSRPPPPSQPQRTPSWTPDWMPPEHRPTSSYTADNTRKRKRVIIESSSSSDSESSRDVKVEYVVISSDDERICGPDVQEVKQAQEGGKQIHEGDVQDVQEEKQKQEEDGEELKEENQTEEEEKQNQEEDGEELKEENQTEEEEKQNQEDDSPTRIVFYDAADFGDFDKLRGNNCFETDQLWAAYDEEDGMPRFYAIITEVRHVDFMLKYTWLEVDKDNEIGRPNLPVSVGKFEVGDAVESNTCANFSHLVCNNISRRLTRGRNFTVFPKKGETWALFKNWDNLIKSTDIDSPSTYEYEFVEILSDHVEGTNISVGFLSKVEGYKSVFCPLPNGNSCEILEDEFCRFSHGIPSFRLTGKAGRGVTEGCYELDPAALPA